MTLEAMFGLDITQSELVYTDYLTVSIDEPGRSVESSEWLRGEERTETLTPYELCLQFAGERLNAEEKALLTEVMNAMKEENA